MPMVGGKKFPYTPAGKKKAAEAARKIKGKPVPLPKKDAGRGNMVPMPKKKPNLINGKPKMAPKKPGLKKKPMSKYGQVGRA